jgi:glycogen synthase
MIFAGARGPHSGKEAVEKRAESRLSGYILLSMDRYAAAIQLPASPARAPGEVDHTRPVAGAVLFEVAWEVCNQVGGIYQVLRSKAATIGERWHDKYCLIGPYVEAKAALEFEPVRASGWMGRLVAALREEGLVVHHGRWLVPGNPRVLLIEHSLPPEELNKVKFRLWSDHRIESPSTDPLIDGAISFGDAVRRVLEKAAHFWCGPGARGRQMQDRRVAAHFHEWLGGLALPMLRKADLPIACIFTTHATLLGRYIASNEEGFYDRLPTIRPEVEAERYGVKTQYQMERTCAHQAHVFTTVSSITGEECAHLLGRAPDLVLPNGLNIPQYYAAHQMQILHAEYKEKLHQFTMGHFFPSYAFDLDKTLYFFTSGRYEPRNKGFDLCLEALARLNAELKSQDLGVTVVFFIVTHRPTRSLNPVSLEKRGVLNELRDVCREIMEGVGEKLFRHGAAGERIHLDDQVDEYWRLRYKRTQFALKTNRLPLIVTHMLDDDAADPVLNQMRHLNLINRAEDPVKVVYHPEFINPVNPLWGIEYEQFVRGCHLGLFPSLYEPWGYTPLECLALGVPAITSDLAGFGRHVAENLIGHEELGLTVLRRRGRPFFDAAGELAQQMLHFCQQRRRDRIALRNASERLSWEFDWSRLGTAYHRAHDLALQRVAERAP